MNVCLYEDIMRPFHLDHLFMQKWSRIYIRSPTLLIEFRLMALINNFIFRLSYCIDYGGSPLNFFLATKQLVEELNRWNQKFFLKLSMKVDLLLIKCPKVTFVFQSAASITPPREREAFRIKFFVITLTYSLVCFL